VFAENQFLPLATEMFVFEALQNIGETTVDARKAGFQNLLLSLGGISLLKRRGGLDLSMRGATPPVWVLERAVSKCSIQETRILDPGR
jgi:hypothetical protein